MKLDVLGQCSKDSPSGQSIVPWVSSGVRCPADELLSYARAMLLLHVVEALVEGAAATTSLRGSIMDPSNRRWCIAPLGYVHAVLSALELMGAILGLQLSYMNDVDADGFDLKLVRQCCGSATALDAEQDQMQVYEGWVEAAIDAIDRAGQLVHAAAAMVCVLSCLVVCFSCCTHHSVKRDERMGGRSADANLKHRLYRIFSTKMKCCVDELNFSGAGEENPINVLAKILSSFFRGISRNDFVPTDVFAAILLVAQSQKYAHFYPQQL